MRNPSSLPASPETGGCDGIADESAIQSHPLLSAAHHRHGTVLTTTMNSVCTMIGGGILSLPYITAKASICTAAATLVLAALMGFASSYFLVAACSMAGKYTYCEILQEAIPRFHPDKVARLLDGFVCIAVFMTQVVYFHVIGQSAFPILSVTWTGNGVENSSSFQFVSSSYTWTVAAAAACLCCVPLRTLRELFLITIFGVVVMLYVSSVVVVEYVSGAQSVPIDDIEGCTFNANALPAITTFAGAFLYQMNIPTLFEELGPQRSVRSMMNSVSWTYATGLLLYGAVAYCGYRSFGSAVLSSHAAGNVIANYPSSDVWMTVGRAALSLHLCCASPIYISIGRRSFLKACFGTTTESASRLQHYGVGIAFIVLAALGGIWIPNIGMSAQFTGAVLATTISVTIPSLLYCCLLARRSNIESLVSQRVLLLCGGVLTALGVLLTVSSVVVSVQSLVA